MRIPVSGASRARKGEKSKLQSALQEAAASDLVKSGQITPLEYMLNVINDDTADQARRDRMAQAAAPYVHPRPEPVEATGKKAQREAAARVAERGTDWESLLVTAPN